MTDGFLLYLSFVGVYIYFQFFKQSCQTKRRLFDNNILLIAVLSHLVLVAGIFFYILFFVLLYSP